MCAQIVCLHRLTCAARQIQFDQQERKQTMPGQWPLDSFECLARGHIIISIFHFCFVSLNQQQQEDSTGNFKWPSASAACMRPVKPSRQTAEGRAMCNSLQNEIKSKRFSSSFDLIGFEFDHCGSAYGHWPVDPPSIFSR